MIPTFRIVEPTPQELTQEPAPGPSTPPPRHALSSHRVLYRGSLSFPSSESDIPLEGICFIAHFNPTSTTKSALRTSSLPLSLESQRGRAALNIISVVSLASLDQRLDDSIDVKMYIHPQSIICRAYFERIFCTDNIRPDGRSSLGVRIRLDDLGVRQHIIVTKLLMPIRRGRDR
ncbi:hypothetical protein BS47DRAFT_767658 [Hydnum rufescens UP504]|uniref:Uncharacterized protein n=1 Tax=Hydnum rufescens UP504 TaxID=1448309 RepID=A0A9P6DYD7_9AGAM|nr:hypothetical protein BS47DRAFT_767658 [Hydnum rufescens UP504]